MDLVKIALRNLLRYKRRTLLTASLITIGVVFVLVFMAVSGSFKAMMIGQITDAMLGHIQIHKKGYVASIDNLPLNLNLKASTFARWRSRCGSRKTLKPTRPASSSGGSSAISMNRRISASTESIPSRSLKRFRS